MIVVIVLDFELPDATNFLVTRVNIKDIVKLMTRDSNARQELSRCVFKEDITTNPLGHANSVFIESLAVDQLFDRMRAAIKAGNIPKVRGLALIEAASKAGIISKLESKQLRDFDKNLMSVINVDDFDPSELVREVSPGSTIQSTA